MSSTDLQRDFRAWVEANYPKGREVSRPADTDAIYKKLEKHLKPAYPHCSVRASYEPVIGGNMITVTVNDGLPNTTEDGGTVQIYTRGVAGKSYDEVSHYISTFGLA